MPQLATAVWAFNAGKAVMGVAAVQIPVDDLSHVRPKEAILFLKTLLVDLFKGFKMILNTLIIL